MNPDDYLSREQYDQLVGAINENRVGKDGKGFRHLAAYEVRAHLIRIFGFARWSANTTVMERVFETESVPEKSTDKPRWTVCYRASVTLTVCSKNGTELATYTEWATGEATNQPSRGDANDLAIKTAESQAFKRAAVNLGDAFGISLYGAGSTKALVGRSLVVPDGVEQPAAAASASVDAHVTGVDITESEQVQPLADTHEQSTAPVKAAPDETDARELRVKDLTAQLLAASKRAEVGGIAAQIGKERLGSALTFDADDNALTLNTLLDQALKRVTRSAA